MKEKLIALLETRGYPVYFQSSIAPAEYPEAFFTFWNASVRYDRHYDNAAARRVWEFIVTFMANDPQTVDTVSENAVRILNEGGFLIRTIEDAASDNIQYTGRLLTILYIESI